MTLNLDEEVNITVNAKVKINITANEDGHVNAMIDVTEKVDVQMNKM